MTVVSARAALLQALCLAPGSGHDLVARVKAHTGGRVVLLTGSVYPALHALVRDGLIVPHDVPGVPGRHGGGVPIPYRITEAGERLARQHAETVRALFALGLAADPSGAP